MKQSEAVHCLGGVTREIRPEAIASLPCPPVQMWKPQPGFCSPSSKLILTRRMPFCLPVCI